jgi:hypothetical protein
VAFTIHLIDGVETGGFERAFNVGTNWEVSTAVRSGVQGRYCYKGGNTATVVRLDAFEYQGTNAGTGTIVGFWYKGNPGVSNEIIALRNEADTAFVGARLNTHTSDATRFYLEDEVGTNLATTASGALPSNTWVFIELYYEATATGAAEVFVDGVSVASVGSHDFTVNGTDPGVVWLWIDDSTRDIYFDDIYFGTGAASAADRLGNLDVFAVAGDSSATTGGDALDAGTWKNTQEIPANDSNTASYTDDSSTPNERIAPDTLAVQTNLTGSVTDIDDDPDSPDANWLTASGSSTCRTTFSTPTGNPNTGAGLQNFRVLLRKNATGPAGGTANESLYPDVLEASSGVTGAVTDIDEDPDTKSWTAADPIRATGNNVSTSIHCSFPAPTGDLTVGADLQEFRVLLRPYDSGQTGDPDWRIELWEFEASTWSLVRAGSDTQILNDAGDTVVSFTWNANELTTISGANVGIKVFGTKTGGSGSVRNTVDFGAVEWNNEYDTGVGETQPGYEIKLYENGSEVVAAGSATGNLTDAGGDTVVAFTWDATNLGTADGSLVECYINQTSGADRYIEIGAVEWNCEYSVDASLRSGWIEADSGDPAIVVQRWVDGNVAVTDNDAVWTNDANAHDSNYTTYASTTTVGTLSTNELSIKGISGTDPGIRAGTISQIRFRYKGYTDATGGIADVNYRVYKNTTFVRGGSSRNPFHQTEYTTPWVALSETELDNFSNGWSDLANFRLDFWGDDGTGTMTELRIYDAEIEVTYWDGNPGPAGIDYLQDIIYGSYFMRSQYANYVSGAVTRRFHYGNDVDGMFTYVAGNQTASLSDYFLILSTAGVPTKTQHSRVGMYWSATYNSDLICAEMIAMFAHIPPWPFPYHVIKQNRRDRKSIITL